jgi:hypothetical protein
MRIAFLPSFRIAAGLLLVVLLGVVGCEVLHWRNPVSPEAIYERRSKNRPQNAARAVFCGGVKVDHRRNLVS